MTTQPTALTGIATVYEQFLFPDSLSANLPFELHLDTPLNGRPGLQIIIDTEGDSVTASLHGNGYKAQWYQMIAVPVEYNTGDGAAQGGDMVILPDEKPGYAVRKAPFKVYDCLKPVSENTERNGTVTIPAVNGRAAAYCCLIPDDELAPGDRNLTITADAQEGSQEITIAVHTANVRIPDEHFKVTNWFSLDAITRCHNVDYESPAFLGMLDQYIAAMRRTRQNVFYIELDDRCVTARKPYAFSFEYIKPVIERFFAGGMTTLEIGPLLSRGFRADGTPDMLTDTFTCAMAPDVDFESPEGLDITTAYLQALALFLEENSWDSSVLVHVHDEPDVHYSDDAALESRRRQYYMAVAMLKKYLPQARVVEAVKTDNFRGGIDVWVPTTSGYEAAHDTFDHMRKLGDEVWNYVCCEPEGRWLNRFLDQKVIHSRLLFWGFACNHIGGFLHWGFNQFPDGMNPFAATSCFNPTGLGTNFPCGDAFLIYPGDDGPWLSMRLEAERRGTEDLELLRLLENRNSKYFRNLVANVFRTNTDYTDDEALFAHTYRSLLDALE